MSENSTVRTLIALIEKYEAVVEKQAIQIEEQAIFAEQQKAVISDLQVRITALEEKIAIYKNKKNSGNSHIPPSLRRFQKTQTEPKLTSEK